MEFNRNQWFFIGIFVLLLGIQFRMVTEYVLNSETTQFLAERAGSDADAANFNLATDMGASPQKVVRPPDWLGWCTISVGAVFVLQSLAMRKPGG
ncbi:MAG: hypothetical protein RH917_10475 [Lacipirellulaceae bacterium]